jgi:hypothetical protein
MSPVRDIALSNFLFIGDFLRNVLPASLVAGRDVARNAFEQRLTNGQSEEEMLLLPFGDVAKRTLLELVPTNVNLK